MISPGWPWSTSIQSALAVGLLVLVWLWSFYGLCLRLLIGELVAIALLYYWRPVRVGPKFDFGCLKHLFIIGVPIYIVASLYNYWMTTFDSQFVLYYFGKKGMGLYGPAVQASQAFEFLPLAIIQVIYPRMAEQYGHTGRLKDIVPMTVKPTVMIVLLMIPLAVVGWWLLPVLVRLLRYDYSGGIHAMQWALLPPILLGLSPVNSLFIVAKRQGLYAIAILFGMGTYTGAMFWLVHHNGGLVSFPQAMVAGRIVFILVCYAMIYCLVRRDNARAAQAAA